MPHSLRGRPSQAQGKVEVYREADGTITVVEPYGGPIEFSTEREIWERQPSETDKSWAAFKVYRELLPMERTLARVYEILYKDNPNPAIKAPEHLYVVSGQFRWHERADHYDLHVDAIERDELIRQRIRARKETASLGRAMRQAATRAVGALKAVLFVEVKDPVTGEERIETKSALTPSEITRLAKIGSELERFGLGLEKPSEGVSVNLALGISTLPIAIDDEELQTRAAKILEVRSKTIDGSARLVSGKGKSSSPSGKGKGKG